MEKVFDTLERLTALHSQNSLTVEVYGGYGNKLYKGNVWNIPYHISRCNVRNYDMENYHITINLL